MGTNLASVLSRFWRCAAVLATLLSTAVAWSPSALAQPFNQVVVFGDSNVDSGFYKALSNPGGNSTYNSLWPTAVADGAGAPTTNPDPLKSQVLASFFGQTANPSNTAGGTNYATSGAKNVTINNSQTGGFTKAIPTVTQISNYLTANGGVANGQALYLIYSGDNDIKYALGLTGAGPYPPDPTAYMTQAADQLASAIQSLYSAGARRIIVSGLAYDYPTGGSNANERALKLLYTQTLWSQLTSLGVPFYQGDIDKVRLAISANPSLYGFTHVDSNAADVACTQPGGVTTAWALLCSSNPSAPSTWSSPTAPQTDLFADDQHLATAGQLLMARYFRNLVVPWAATHNFNGDGYSDILWRDTGGNVGMWLMNGSTIVQNTGVANAPTVWSIVGQRDFNGDGKADVLWHDTTGDVGIWLMNGTTITSAAGVANVPTVWSVAGTGDFNGDGKGDILWHDSSGNVGIWLMNGTTISSAAGVANVPPSVWSIAGTGDFNGDGKTDILWIDTSGDVGIWFMNGTTITSASGIGKAPPGWSIVGTGDFNGDGKSDILWRDTAGDVGIWLMNGTAIVSAQGVANVPTVWSVAETGDFNGDGMSDILWSDTSGDVGVWFMNGTTISSATGIANVPTVWSIQGAGTD